MLVGLAAVLRVRILRLQWQLRIKPFKKACGPQISLTGTGFDEGAMAKFAAVTRFLAVVV